MTGKEKDRRYRRHTPPSLGSSLERKLDGGDGVFEVLVSGKLFSVRPVGNFQLPSSPPSLPITNFPPSFSAFGPAQKLLLSPPFTLTYNAEWALDELEPPEEALVPRATS